MLYYLNPLNWFSWFAQFVHAWLLGVQWSRIAGAIPAVIILLLMAVGATVSWSSANRWRDSLVINQIRDATAQERYDVAELLLLRQLRSNPDNENLELQLAQTYEATGRNSESRDILLKQALQNENPKAALWLLKNEYKDVATKDLDDEQFEELAELAKVRLKADPDNFALHSIRAQYWFRQKNVGEAIPHMAKLKEVQLDVGLKIAIILKEQGDERGARMEAEQCIARIAEEIEKDPKRSELRLLQAQVLIFLEKYEEAVRTLATGYDQTKDERLRNAVGEAIIVYSGTLGKQGNDVRSLVTRLKLLQQAVRLAPSNPAVLKAIADTILSTANEEDEQVVALREGILSGASPEIGHFVRGTAAMLKGDSELAAIELRLAAKGLPESAAILNNLAVAKTSNAKNAGNDQKELAEALDLVNKAIELTQNNVKATRQLPYFHETRGQIYLLFQRYEDAIGDFDEALKVDALRLQANLALAAAYEGLGQKNVAEQHRTAAERLRRLELEAAEKKRDAIEQFGEQLKSTESILPDTKALESGSSKTQNDVQE